MNVFVFSKEYDYEGETIISVHANLASAWKAMLARAITDGIDDNDFGDVREGEIRPSDGWAFWIRNMSVIE